MGKFKLLSHPFFTIKPYFSINLQNCKNCIFSSNLINKQYYIYNKSYSKENYKKILKTFKEKLSSYSELSKLKEDYKKLKKESVYKNLQKTNTQGVIGNFISDSKNVILSFHADNIEDSLNVYGGHIKNCVNFIGGGMVEYIYNSCMISYDTQKVIGSFDVFYSNNIINSIGIYYSNDIIFSLGLKNKKYCILNRTYTKEKYKQLSGEIIDNLKKDNKFGDFFDINLTKIPYNDSPAIDFFPIKKIIYPDKKEIILSKNGKGIVTILNKDSFISKAILNLGGERNIDITWRNFEKEVNIPKGIKLIKTKDIPDNIKDLSIDFEKELLSSAVICKESQRPFKIMKYELNFYKKNNLPIPRLHPKFRHKNRGKETLSRELYLVNCEKCSKKIISAYNNKDNKIVYCEDCYKEQYI